MAVSVCIIQSKTAIITLSLKKTLTNKQVKTKHVYDAWIYLTKSKVVQTEKQMAEN